MHPEEGVLSSHRKLSAEKLQSHTAYGTALHGGHPAGSKRQSPSSCLALSCAGMMGVWAGGGMQGWCVRPVGGMGCMAQ